MTSSTLRNATSPYRWIPSLGVLFLALMLSGCELPINLGGGGGNGGGSELDEALEEALVDASEGQGTAFFMLPDSDDFISIPQDPRNRLTQAKVELGQLLYHETALMVNPVRPEGQFSGSCASCHHAAAGFQAGRIQGVGEGGWGFGMRGEGRINNPNYALDELDVQPIRSPTAMNGAYQEVMLWNGQFGATGVNAGTEANWTPETPIATNHLGYEGLEIQAIAGLSVHRMGDIEETMVVSDPTYQQMFARAFPGQPIDRERTGLAIAAYERTLLANQAPFQAWLRGNTGAMSEEQKRGALLFFGDAGCADCHTGPALNSMTFFALGMADLQGSGVYGDFTSNEANLGRASFTKQAEDEYKFKTPQLYNLVDSPFMGHGGTFRSVREVVDYKNRAIPDKRDVPRQQLASAFRPLGLDADEVDDLVAFIEGALYDPDLVRYVPDSVPSGGCLPANDTQSRTDLGCQ